MKKLAHLVSAVLMVAFVMISIPKVIQRRADSQKVQATSGYTTGTTTVIGGGTASAPVTSTNTIQPDSASQAGNPYPPPRILPPAGTIIDSAQSAPSINVPVETGSSPLPAAQESGSTMFTRWATVMVLFGATLSAGIGLSLAAFFAAHKLRQHTTIHTLYRN